MDKDHVAILLEEIKSKWELAFERFDGMEKKFDVVVADLAALKTGQAELKMGQEEIKNTVGLLHTIANEHETQSMKLGFEM